MKIILLIILQIIVLLKETVTAKMVLISNQGDSEPDTGIDNLSSLTTGTGIFCDTIQCPVKSRRCLVKKDSVPGKPEILVQRICKSSKGVTLYEEAETLPQLDGPEDYHSISETAIGGSFSSRTKFLSRREEKDLENELLNQARALEQQTKSIGASIRKTISKALEGLFRRTAFPFQ